MLVSTVVGLGVFPAAAQTQQDPCWPVLIEIFTTEDSSAHLPMTRALERLAAERGPGRVIPLEYHIDDQYAVPGSEARQAVWEVRYMPALVGRVHPSVTTDEDTAYQDLQLSLLQLGKWFPPPTLEVDVSRSISDGRVALQAQIENRGESSVADLQVIFVLYQDLGRDGYRFVVRDVSSPRSVVRIETGARIEISAELSLPEDASHDRVEAVALVQQIVGSVQSPLRVLAAGTTATAYPFPPPMPEEAAPATGLLERPQVLDLRAILIRLRPWLAGGAALTVLLLLLAAATQPHTFRYALRSLLGRADRTALLLLGVLAASLGVSLLSSVTEAAEVRVGRELAAYWRTTYDLLVRPAGSRSAIEGQYNLLEAHYESGLAGGITIAQYEAIKALPDVKVAAPLAAIGYVDLKTGIRTRPLPAGIYRVERTTTVDNGMRTIPLAEEQYFLAAPEIPNPTESPFDGWLALQGQAQAPLSLPLGITGNTLLVAIDPEAEAALVGLQNATLEGRYFTTEDRVEGEETSHVYPDGRPAVLYEVPVLINAHPYISFTVEYTLSRIALPTPGMPTLEALQALAHAGGREYLERAPGQVVLQRVLDAAQGYAMIFSTLGQETNMSTRLETEYIVPNPIHYREMEVSLAEELVLEAVPVGRWGQEVNFRRQSALGMGRTSMFRLKTIGAFDLARLLEAQALSPNAVPLETYLPPQAVLKYDEEGQPVEPAPLRPTFNPGGYVTTPPLILAPLELAELLGGPAPISCIRVRVAGIEEMGEGARAKIETLAQEIVERTGLEVDVMVGSSPQPVLVHIPGYGDVPPTGYVEELWVKKNVDTAILRDTQWTGFLVLGLTLGVCALYVASVSYLSVLGRQGELGLLKAMGWRTSAVVGLILSEQMLVGVIGGAGGISLALALTYLAGLAIPVEAALLMLPLGVGLCLVGGLAPARRAVALPPAHVVRAGEVRARGRAPGRLSVAGYSSRHLLRRRGRALAAVLMLALATALLAFMGLVTISARRFLETTLLGQHVALEVRGYHLAVALLCALVAALAVGDLTLLNARERRREMGLLRAAGWRANGTNICAILPGAEPPG
ncbi:MAG: ABC transporter permease [Chloroflexota bacterium]|nr:ABC transporter permease [Chloroflexota bacterium]